MKALVGAFNQEKALVGAFSVIVKTGCGTDGLFYSTKAYLIVSVLRQVRGRADGGAGAGGQDGGPAWRDAVSSSRHRTTSPVN